MSEEKLRAHRDTWYRKPVLRQLYTEWYQLIIDQLVAGPTLELGGGSGHLKHFLPDAVCTDLVHVPWLDAVADAQKMPFRDHTFANLVLFDVLHHIENIPFFFDEALRVLRPGGRIVIMDPYVSPASMPLYRFLHPEPVDFKQQPLTVHEADPDRQPFDSNQAIARLLFDPPAQSMREHYPQLTIVEQRYLSFLVYPLSGGFDHPSLIPSRLLPWMFRLEQRLARFGRQLAYRTLVVLEVEQ